MTLIYYFKIEYIMGFNNIKFISNNVRAIKTQTKELRYLNTLKRKSILTECYSFKKRIPVKKMKKSGMTVLKEHYSFCMEQQTPADLL